MSRWDDPDDEALVPRMTSLFATESEEQAGDELRAMRVASRTAMAFVRAQDDSLRAMTLTAFGRESALAQQDACLEDRLVAGAVRAATSLQSGRPKSYRSSQRRWLGMPMGTFVMLLSSGVLAASGVLVAKVFVPSRLPAPPTHVVHATKRVHAPAPQTSALEVPAEQPAAGEQSPEPELLAAPADASAEPASASRLPPKRTGASVMFAQANKHRRAGNLPQAEVLYRRLLHTFSGTPEAGLARLSLAELAENRRQPKAALRHLNAFLAGQSSPALVQEALRNKARLLQSSGHERQARTTWHELLKRFPDTIYRAEAERMMQGHRSLP